jgi:hypothetical protein
VKVLTTSDLVGWRRSFRRGLFSPGDRLQPRGRGSTQLRPLSTHPQFSRLVHFSGDLPCLKVKLSFALTVQRGPSGLRADRAPEPK